MIRKSLIIFFIFMCLFFALTVNAQVQNGDILIEVAPKYPKPNENVSVSLSTFTTDLNSAKISWTLNGETKIEGIGKKDFSFTTDSSGSQSTIEAKIEIITGSVINKKITISISSIDLLWEASDTYTPPFYKGKTLAPIEGTIKVVAMPNITNMAGFSYTWKQDNKNKTHSSGYEKNYYLYKNSYLEKNSTIEVSASDIFGGGIGSSKIKITPNKPKIIIYEKDSLLGTRWESTINDGFTIKEDGTTLVAEPYFFSPKNLNSSNLTFEWFLNGEPTLIPNQKNILSIKPDGGTSGNSNVKIVINNVKTLFQSMEKQLNVNF